MPFTPVQRQAVQSAVIARVRAGATVAAACRGEGFPALRTFYGWTRRYPSLRQELEAALVDGRWRRTRAFDAAKAEALLARVAAGERLADLWADPQMPGRTTYDYWRQTQPAFAEAMRRLRAGQRERLAGRGRAGRRDYDPGLADRVLARVWASDAPLHAILKADPTLPCYQTLARWRRQEPAFDARLSRLLEGWKGLRKARRARARCAALTPAIVDHIRAGGSLLTASQAPGAPAANTLYRWMAEHPDFAAAVTRACEDREDVYLDAMVATVEAGGGATPAARRAAAGLSRQLTRLRHRPGKWGRRAKR